MNKIIFPGGILLVLLVFYGCETPNAPDFGVRQSVDFPVLLSKKFTFLGDANSLIDTTGTNFDSLFAVDNEGLVRLSLTNDFDFRDFDEVIPRINIDSTNIFSPVGPIRFTVFSDSMRLGEIPFDELTQQSDLQEGDRLPGGASPVIRIDLDTNRFKKGRSIEGAIQFNFTNNLGFDIRRFSVFSLVSNDQFVGNAGNIGNIKHGESDSARIEIAEGTPLEIPLQLVIQLTWDEQNLKSDPGMFVFKKMFGDSLMFFEVTGVQESQTLGTVDSASIGLDEFEFTSPDDFVEIERGSLVINNILNNTDVAFQEVIISSPELLVPQTGEPTLSDSLTIRLQIPRNSDGLIEETIDLSGTRIKSPNNRITYHVKAVTERTENAPEGDRIRTLQATDNLVFDISVRDVQISAAQGLIKPVMFILNDDQPANGLNVVDLMRLDEAQQTTIDGIANLSNNTEDLVFLNPTLNLKFRTNIGLPTTIIGAILGLDSRRNGVFLSGEEGGAFQVSPTDEIITLVRNGKPVERKNLFKINVNPAENEALEGTISFNTENSTISRFVSNIPNDIRFIGQALVNEPEETGFVNSPVEIDLGLNLEVPLNIATSERPAVIEDTVAVKSAFSGLPDANSNTQITDARINIVFTNTLPLSSTITLDFLKANNGALISLFKLPATAADNLTIGAAEIDLATRFTIAANEGLLEVNLTNEQALALQQTEYMVLRSEFLTVNPAGVKIQKNNALTLEISAHLTFESQVD